MNMIMSNNSIFRFLLAFTLLLFASATAFAQKGIIKGRVFNEINNESLEFATIMVQNTTNGAFADSAGNFQIKGLKPGLYNVEARYGGFKTEIVYEIQVTNSKPYVIEIPMREDDVTTDSVVIVASPFRRIEEAPLSLRTIGTSEIKRNPGGNRDISRVIQSLPGVASTVSFRNDILIRGGAPNENRFYIDGIETPNINHFATQGASGGPVGLINVDFIGEVDFYSGAFPANRGNALSSVFEFKQREARDDRLGFTATVGASDLALTVEGPVTPQSTFLFSARQSYLQGLFKILGLPFLPTYNDFQFKQKIRLGERHQITLVGLGAVDRFRLNLEADTTESQKYILGNIPVQTQDNYTAGINYKYFGNKGFWQVVLSRNAINFGAEKFVDNDETKTQLLDYTSQEIENKLRIERTARKKNFKWSYGVNLEQATYRNSTFNVLPFGILDFDSELNLVKYGAFGQLSTKLFGDRLILSAGVRTDGNDFSPEMMDLTNQISPRFSASYALTPRITANFNTGIYYQLPPYTVLGFRNNENQLLNTDITYIENRQLVAGFAYLSETNSKISIEGYYKQYDNYPFMLGDSVSLANLGGDFGAIGNGLASSTSQGQAYGIEVLLQQRLYKGFYGILAYTLGWSEFTDKNGDFRPSAWDSRHIIALTMGKKFKKDWEIGVKWRLQSGTPYTPADIAASSLIPAWNSRGREIPNYDVVNSERTRSFHQLDFRIDKKWFFEKWSLNAFFDIQNAYFYSVAGAPILNVLTDENDIPQIDPNDPSRYQTYFIENSLGIVQPTIGLVFTY